jgi:hypothetical protein
VFAGAFGRAADDVVLASPSGLLRLADFAASAAALMAAGISALAAAAAAANDEPPPGVDSLLLRISSSSANFSALFLAAQAASCSAMAFRSGPPLHASQRHTDLSFCVSWHRLKS